ncbi:MAG TPA: NHL repeat-containing protein [Pyrinomonadaceae bacterium]
MTRTQQPARRRRRLLVAVVFVVLAAFVCAAALSVYLRRRARPIPTVTGWRARVSTLAGDGAPGAHDDNAAARSRFGDPFGAAVDAQGNVFVADAGASNRIRKINAQGFVTTLAGGAEGYADGAGASASFSTPSALAIDGGGNLYVADTGNNRIRKIAPDGTASSVAGSGSAGFRDGTADAAQFDAPVGVAVDAQGGLYVADTYNDRIRVVTPAGEVRTLAGGGQPGYADGDAGGARFDTPCGVAVMPNGVVIVADTGNDRLRRVTTAGQVTTVNLRSPDQTAVELSSPVGLAATHDNFLYVTEQDRGRVWQVAPDDTARLVAGAGLGFADGEGQSARFNQPAGVAVDRAGALYVADAANYLVRKIAPADQTSTPGGTTGANANSTSGATTQGGPTQPDVTGAPAIPRLDAETLGIARLPYPLDPQGEWHEVAATMGEVRGSFDSTDARDHLHSGIDIFGPYGATVRAVYEEKVASPIPNWGFGGLNEGLRVGAFAYIHQRVGRSPDDKVYADPRFVPVYDERGKLARVRVRRGTRFRAGDALGTVNRMYHVHLNFGAPANETNPLALPLANFADRVAPTIARDGIMLFDAAGSPLKERRDGRLVVRGAVRVVVDAFDQVDGNAARRRLGLYRLGFQLVNADGSPAPGFAQPRAQIEFDRLPPQRDAVKIAYADKSGITVYGSDATHFFYELTNTVRHGGAFAGAWDSSELPAGDYTLRVFAADFAGNVATANRDLAIRVER